MIWSFSIRSMRPSSCAIKDRPFILVGEVSDDSRVFEKDSESQSFFFFFEGQYFRCSANCKLHSFCSQETNLFSFHIHSIGWVGDGSCQLWYMVNLGENADASFKSISIPQMCNSIDPCKWNSSAKCYLVSSMNQMNVWVYQDSKFWFFSPVCVFFFLKNFIIWLTITAATTPVPSVACLYHWHMVFGYNKPKILSSNSQKEPLKVFRQLQVLEHSSLTWFRFSSTFPSSYQVLAFRRKLGSGENYKKISEKYRIHRRSKPW